MNNLNRCDLALATFSFGNSNGTLDAALLGIPTVALLCPDPHAQTDWRLPSRLGLADELVATSPDQYLAIARRLVEDRAAREALQARLGSDQVAATIHQDLPRDSGMDFGASLLWLYHHHTAIRAGGCRHVTTGEALA